MEINQREIFEKVKCNQCKNYDCGNDYIKETCYSEYLEKLVDLMLNFLIRRSKAQHEREPGMLDDFNEKTTEMEIVEQITQKKIGELI
jgi:hypothetical protein